MLHAAALGRELRQRAAFVLPAFFLVLVVPVILFSAVLTPTAEVPDEVAHIVRANSLLHGVVVGRVVATTDALGRPAKDAGVDANPALIAAGFAFAPGVPKQLTKARLAQQRDVPWAPATAWIPVPNTAGYMPLFYLPAAFGLGTAHLAGLGPYHAIIAARLCAALSFAGLGVAALLLARRAQGALFAALALPMTIALAGSCNQDGLMIATACLGAALWTRPSLGAWWAGMAALALVIAAKPPYLPLAGLAVFAAPARRAGIGLLLAALLATVLPALLWYALAQRHAIVPFLQPAPYAAGPLWPGPPGELFASWDPAQQLRVVRQHPELLLTLPWQTLRDDGFVLARGVVGILGTLDVMLPDWLYQLWFWALGSAALAAVLSNGQSASRWPAWAGLLGLGCIVGAALAVIDGAYLSFTAIGAAAVGGVQGRYALPLLPLIGLVLPRLGVPFGGLLRPALLSVPVLAAAAGLLVIPRLLIASWYLH